MAITFRESDRHFLLSLIVATGIIIFWKGIWEGIGSLPIIENPWVDIFIGLVILTFTQAIFKEFDPLGGLEKGALKVIDSVHHHPEKDKFVIRYYDSIQKKEVEFSAKDLRHIEKNTLTVHENGREIFIPIHRVRSIHKNGRAVWRL
ncbi:MAG: DUF504 domain-containing protein [Candidatus Aenigmarchaeota archaeon]|nr:DUF504 domain-containing protein [Candidatus Aenigmarchaeota archaeon]